MTEIKGHDMGRFQRLVLVKAPRVDGTFAVSLPTSPDREAWVTAHNVDIWDGPGRNFGRCLHSGDLTGSVKDGVASLSKHMVKQSLLFDVEDVWDEILQVMVAAVEAAIPDPKGTP